jgi:hypothetical protein
VNIGDAASGDRAGVQFFALRRVNLTADPGAPTIGYDLDGVCTCDPRPATAHGGSSSCSIDAGLKPCDADGGVDNSLSDVIAKFSGLVDINQGANINPRIDRGEQNAIILITKYNGRANDKDIGVGIFTSEGILNDAGANPGLQPGCPDSGFQVSSNTWSPGWCGTDRWSVSNDTVNRSNTKFEPKLVGSGYVNNYTFVVKFDGTANVPFASYHLSIGSPIATGRLVPLDANQQPLDPAKTSGPVPFWRIENGVVAGRIPTNEMLAAVGVLVQPGSDGGSGTKHVCTSPFFSALFKPAICPAIDINQNVKLDFDPGARCDAISTAIGFRADAVVLDDFTDSVSQRNECSPSPDDGTRPVEAGPGITYTCP